MKKTIFEVVFLAVLVFMPSLTIMVTVNGVSNVDAPSSSFSGHVMCKDKDGNWNPVNPVTIDPEHVRVHLSVDNLLVDGSKPQKTGSWDEASQLQDWRLFDHENSVLESASPQPASSSTTLFTEGFEGSFPSTNWWVGDDDSRNGADYWDDTSYRSRSGSWSGWCADIGSKPDDTPNTADWTYDDYMAAYLSRRAGAPFDARNWDIAFLTYYVWYDIESGYDELDLSVTGDGTNWGGIFQYDSNSLTSGDWLLTGSSGGVFDYRVGRVPESTSAGAVYTSSFNIGFYFQSDFSIHREGAYLDDISFEVYDVTSPYVSVSKTVASPGDTIQLGYKIDNVSPFDLKIWLGATLTDKYGNQINDPTNDVMVTATPGYRYYYRDFDIPSSANPGTYDITYALWSGWTSPIDQSRQWWTWTWNDILTVEPLNHAPDLSDGYVDPGTGYRDTNFKFLVKYTDQDGDPAVVKKIYVYDSGWWDFDMDHLAGNPIDGEWFIVWLTDFSLGTHDFYFDFTDGDLGDREPTSEYYSFDVVNRPPIVSDGYVNPTSGGPGTVFTFRAKYTDQDGDPADTKRLILDDDGIFYFDMDHVSGDPTSGEWFEKQVTGLHPDSEVGEHRFFFYFTDGEGGEDYDPDDGWHPGPVVEAGGNPKIRVEPASLVFDWYSTGAGTLETTVPYSNQRNSWCEDWFRDRNKNRIDDTIEVYEQHTGEERTFNIFVHYDYHPSRLDLDSLQRYADATDTYENMDIIAAVNVSIDNIANYIVSLPGVVMVEWQGPLVQGGLDVSTKAIKASPSDLYSPNTAWESGYTGNDVNIAILDTGVDNEHESFGGKFIAGYNAITDTVTDPDDDHGHGTHVAGIALGAGGTHPEYKGVAPDAKLIDVKVLDSNGYGTSNVIIRGIDWCITNRDTYSIDIVSMSIYTHGANSDGTDAMSRAVNRAVDAGIVVVAIAGNTPGRYIGPIAAADKAITVGAIDDQNTVDRSDDAIASWSSNGPRDDDGDDDQLDELKPDIVAPGVNIKAPQGDTTSGYVNKDGTSMAAPHIAGVVALMLEKNPTLTPSQIKEILHNTAEDKNGTYDPALDPKYDVAYGWGEVDAFGAALSVLFQTFIVYNDGDADLVVSSISSNRVWLSASPSSFTLAPGVSQDVIATVDPGDLSIGTYSGTLTISSNDAYGNDHFEVDVTLNVIDNVPPPPPIISSPTHPDEESWFSNDDPQFTWTTPEDPSGINGYSYWIDHSSSTIPDTTVDTIGNSASFSDLADGEWWFHVRAVDNADNWGQADHYRIRIDTASPSIIDHTPTGVDVHVTSTITATFSEAMNRASAENAFSISPTVSGAFSWSGNTMTFTSDSDLAYDTTYAVTIGTGAMDSAGNHLQSSYNWQFTTTTPPNQPPSIIDIYPDSEIVFQGDTIRIYCDSSDPEIPENSLTCTIWIRPVGEPWVVSHETMSWDGNNHYYDWNIPTSAKLGYYDVNCTVFDGELSDWRIDYNEFEVVDTTSPVVQITSPTSSSPIYTQSGTPLTVDFTYTELNPKNATIRVHNATHIIGETFVTDLVPGVDVMRSDAVNIVAWATDGEYNVTVTIYDVADQTGTDTQTDALIIDNTPPTVNITYPANGAYIRSTTIHINGTVTEPHTNGQLPHTNDTRFTLTFWNGTHFGFENTTEAISDGMLVLKVNFTDLAGNTGQATVWFTVDNTPPTVTITSPANGSYRQGTVWVNATIVEANPFGYVIAINDTTVHTGSGQVSWQWNTTLYVDGVYAITVTATDAAGNIESDTVTVTVDNTPPAKTVISPTPESYLDFSTIWINETLSDATSGIDPLTIIMTLDGTPVTANYDSISGILSYHAIGLADGNHTVVVSVRDLAENVAINSWWFFVDTTFPTTTIEHAPGSSFVYLTAEDTPPTSGVFAIYFRIDSGPWEEHLGSGPIEIELVGIGSHLIEAYSRDNAGNDSPIVSLTVHYLIVNTDPLGLDAPTGEGWYDNGTDAPIAVDPVPNYSFEYWYLDGQSSIPYSTSMSTTVTMDSPHTATAKFIEIKKDTRILFTFSPNPANSSETVVLLGNLTNINDNPIYPAQVKVEYSTNGGATWGYIWTLTTNADGEFSQTFTAPGAGEYLANVSYAGSDIYNPSWHNETLIVREPTLVEAWVFFNFIPNPATPGTSVTLKGVLVDDSSNPISYATVKVEYSTNDGTTWKYIWTRTTNEYGTFSITFSAPGTGAYLVRVSYEGDSTHKVSSNNAYLIVLSTTYEGETADSIFYNFVPNPATLGSVTLRGILLDEFIQPIASVDVTVEYSTNHGSIWKSIWTLTTNQYGIFSKTFNAPAKGTYLVRVSYGGSSITTYLVVR